MLAFLFRRLGQSLLVDRRDGGAGVRRRLCARQSGRHPDQPRSRPDRARARDRARSASTSRSGCSSGCSSTPRSPAISASSFVHGVPAMDLILNRMPATLELAFVALLLSLGLGIPLGI